MKEKIITTNKNGMAMLIFIIIAYLVAIPLIPIGISSCTGIGTVLGVISIIWVLLGWILALGLKVLKPQEALVLTLFGKTVSSG